MEAETVLGGLSDGPSSHKSRRVDDRRPRNACLNCRKRKTRCDFDIDGSKCRRCRIEELECKQPETDRRGGFTNVLAGRLRKHENELDEGFHPTSRLRGTSLALPEKNIFESELYSASDAIDLLKTASSKKHSYAGQSSGLEPNDVEPGLFRDSQNPESSSPSSRGSALENSDIVREGILKSEEVVRMVEFFFVKIAPFYVTEAPWEYEEISMLASEPALLTVICTIGACFLKGESFEWIHRKLWNYTRHTLTSLLWDCDDEQASSVIFAVTILCEHMPGALLYNERYPGEIFRKHTRICWPLMGQAVRLAHYVGLSQCNAKVNIALHFCDYLLAIRLGRMPMLDLMASTEEEFPAELVEQLPIFDRARLGLVKLLQLANNYLYRSRTEVRHLVASGQCISTLNLIFPLVEKWKEDFRVIIQGKSWAARTTIFEFSHVELYIYSIAFSTWHQEGQDRLFMWRERYRFSKIAVAAAKSIITHESSSDIPVELRYSPIQWITRLLHASVFLVKTLLTGSLYSNVNEVEETIGHICIAAQTMSQLPTHNNQTFSKSLLLICDKLRMQFNSDKESANQNRSSQASGLPVQTELDFLHEPSFSDLQHDFNDENIWDLLFNEDLAMGMGDITVPDS